MHPFLLAVYFIYKGQVKLDYASLQNLINILELYNPNGN